jgi:hypothetical protein
MKATAFLPADPQRAHVIWSELWKNVKALTYAGHALEVEVRPERRNDPQNRRLHAMLGDIARQLDWAGSKREVDVWKRLLTSAWLRARGESVEILPAVDGHGVDIVFRHTSKLTKAECGELMEYVSAWAIEHGVEFSEPHEASAP